METLSSSFTATTTIDILGRSMIALGIQPDMKTETATVQSILVAMKLDDFKTTYGPMAVFFEKIVTNPQELGPLLKNVMQGITEKHPAILEFAQKALHENWFSDSKLVRDSVHVAFILEALTAAMCNSELFFNEMMNHIRQKEQEIGIDSTHLIRTIWNNWPRSGDFSGSFFATAKAASLDPAMVYFKLRRKLGGATLTKEYVKDLYKSGNMSYLEYKLLLPACKGNACYCSDWLRINIYEAGITEFNNGLKSNAMSAHVLSEDAKIHCHREEFKSGSILPEGELSDFYRTIQNDDNFFPTFSFHQEWVSLYESWNMAFILGELNNLHFLFPKLLIPSVLNAKPENFLGARIIALWLSINNGLFLNHKGTDKIEGPLNKKEMAKAWGEINKKYALRLSASKIQEDSEILVKSFSKRFSRPFLNLAKLILRFLF